MIIIIFSCLQNFSEVEENPAKKAGKKGQVLLKTERVWAHSRAIFLNAHLYK